MKLLPETIREIPIFSGLSREDIAKVVGKNGRVLFQCWNYHILPGDRGDAFYFIESGAVKLWSKAQREDRKLLPCSDRGIALENWARFPAIPVPQA
jgi:hypothetical protein